MPALFSSIAIAVAISIPGVVSISPDAEISTTHGITTQRSGSTKVNGPFRSEMFCTAHRMGMEGSGFKTSPCYWLANGYYYTYFIP